MKLTQLNIFNQAENKKIFNLDAYGIMSLKCFQCQRIYVGERTEDLRENSIAQHLCLHSSLITNERSLTLSTFPLLLF